MSKQNHKTVVTVFIAVVISFLFAGTVHAEGQNNPQSNNSRAEQILRGIAALPASKVLLQHECTMPPAEGGTETVLEHNGTRYTLWIWDWKPETTPQVTWSRIYCRQAGSASQEDIWVVADAHLDGKVDTGFPANTENPPVGGIMTNLDCTGESFSIPNVTILQETEEQKKRVRTLWQDRYDKVLEELEAFLASKSR